MWSVWDVKVDVAVWDGTSHILTVRSSEAERIWL